MTDITSANTNAKRLGRSSLCLSRHPGMILNCLNVHNHLPFQLECSNDLLKESDEDLDFKVIYTSATTCALLRQIALGRVNLNYASKNSHCRKERSRQNIHQAAPTCVLPYHGHLQIIRLLLPCKVFDLPADFAHVLYHINYAHGFSSKRVA